MDNQQTLNIMQIQQDLQEAGFYKGRIDGIWGDKSKDAFEEALSVRQKQQICRIGNVKPNYKKVAWGEKVSQEFKERVHWIAAALRMPAGGADWLMACMAWESAETFSPSVKNMAGSGAVGLIQFMPKTAIGLGTTTIKLANMTAVQQLEYVYKYFSPYEGKLNNLSDVYMAILWPLAVGKPERSTLWDKNQRPTTYRQNAGLDINKDGVITKAEAAAKVQQTLNVGLEKYRG